MWQANREWCHSRFDTRDQTHHAGIIFSVGLHHSHIILNRRVAEDAEMGN